MGKSGLFIFRPHEVQPPAPGGAIVQPTPQDLSLATVTFVASIIYIAVGVLFLRRHVDPQARLAQYGFSAWWLALGMVGIISLPLGLGLNLPDAGLTVWRIFLYTFFPALFLGLGGLVYYLAYLYSGNARLRFPILVFYVLLTALLVWLIEGFSPHLGINEEGETDVLFEPEQPRWASLLFSMALVLPPLAASGAYLMLYRRVDRREERYRILLVGGGILLWFGYSLLNTILSFAAQTENEPSFGSQMVGALLGLASSTLVLLAFWPPRRIRRWLEANSRS